MKKIFLVVTMVVSVFANSQEIKPIKMVIEQGIPGESFSKTTMGLEFWIQEREGLVYIDHTKTKVTELNDNSGRSLLEAHQKAVAERKKYVDEQSKKGRHLFSSRSEKLIDFNASKRLRDTLGFKFVLDSWAIPSINTTGVHCKADLFYYVSDSDAKQQEYISKNNVLNSMRTIKINDKEVEIQQKSSSRYNNERFLGYELKTSDVGMLIEKIEQVDDTGKSIKVLFETRAIDIVRFSVNENDIAKTIHLKFTMRPLKQKRLLLRQKIGVGLVKN